MQDHRSPRNSTRLPDLRQLTAVNSIVAVSGPVLTVCEHGAFTSINSVVQVWPAAEPPDRPITPLGDRRGGGW